MKKDDWNTAVRPERKRKQTKWIREVMHMWPRAAKEELRQ